MRRSNRADYKSATHLELEVISNRQAIANCQAIAIWQAITNWKDNHARRGLMAGMAIVVQEIQGLFGKLFIGIKPA
jgi:hypothetical protein